MLLLWWFFFPRVGKKTQPISSVFEIQLISKHSLMSAPVERVSGAAHSQAYAEPPHFDAAHRDRDCYLARVWKHVFLRRPQRDNYCQLNCSGCSACSDCVPLTHWPRLAAWDWTSSLLPPAQPLPLPFLTKTKRRIVWKVLVYSVVGRYDGIYCLDGTKCIYTDRHAVQLAAKMQTTMKQFC